ncbi:MAG TPA: YggT family protein [Pyrinomonadaceae bacterium]|jgi:YggT family protein
MQIVSRIYLFLNWLIISAAVGLILLMVLRLIATAMDWNPFTWSALTIRRLSEPLIAPIRRGLTRFQVDPKYAPLVLILIIVLFAWFTIQVLATVANTLIGVWISATSGALAPLIGYLLYGLLSLYSLMIFVRIILSWGMLGSGSRVMRFLINATEPLLAPLRRTIPPVGMFDISPIVAFIIVWICQAAVAGLLLQGQRIEFIG